jgi:hypothetical protein
MINYSGTTFLPDMSLTHTLESRSQKLCDCCGSKIYPGDTVYICDRQYFCEDCVEVAEFAEYAEY